MHNDYIFPANQVDAFTVITPGRLDRLDQLASEGVNAVEGGTYTPESPVMIGGPFVELNGASCVLAGGVRTGPGSKGIVLQPSVYPTFAVPRTRTFRVWLTNMKEFERPELSNKFLPRENPYGLQHVEVGTGRSEIHIKLPSFRLNHGATLTRVSLSMRYGRRPPASAIATDPPTKIQVYRIAGDGSIVVSPNDIELFLAPTFQPSTGYALGDVVVTNPTNSVQYRCTQGGVSGASLSGTTIFSEVTSGTTKFRVEHGPDQATQGHSMFPAYQATADATLASYYRDGTPFDLEFIPNRLAVLDTVNYSYALAISSAAGCDAIFHSLEVAVGNIATYAAP